MLCNKLTATNLNTGALSHHVQGSGVWHSLAGSPAQGLSPGCNQVSARTGVSSHGSTGKETLPSACLPSQAVGLTASVPYWLLARACLWVLLFLSSASLPHPHPRPAACIINVCKSRGPLGKSASKTEVTIFCNPTIPSPLPYSIGKQVMKSGPNSKKEITQGHR